MAGKKTEKTNVMRVLDQKKVPYKAHEYAADATLSGEQIARILGEDPERVFKTLVTQGRSGQYYVFVVPVKSELDLKKAAKAAGVLLEMQRSSYSKLGVLNSYVHDNKSVLQ